MNLSIQYKLQKFLMTAELNLLILYITMIVEMSQVCRARSMNSSGCINMTVSVIAFTDGAVTENGKGSSAYVYKFLPLEVGDSVA